MRSRASAATPGPWRVSFISGTAPVIDGPAGDGHLVAETYLCGHAAHDGRRRADAAHIAAWCPSVAAAVAAWLEDEAGKADGMEVYEDTDAWPLWLEAFAHPLAVARAYLGEESP